MRSHRLKLRRKDGRGMVRGEKEGIRLGKWSWSSGKRDFRLKIHIVWIRVLHKDAVILHVRVVSHVIIVAVLVERSTSATNKIASSSHSSV